MNQPPFYSYRLSNAPLTELRGTFLEVSSRYAPAAYSLRRVSDAFDQWAVRQPVSRLTRVYEHLIEGRLDPHWDELGLPPGA